MEAHLLCFARFNVAKVPENRRLLVVEGAAVLGVAVAAEAAFPGLSAVTTFVMLLPRKPRMPLWTPRFLVT
jgi:hypothetical protein